MPEAMTPAEELRAAAAKLRETAAAITHLCPTPWRAAPPAEGDDQWLVGYATDNPLAGLVATTPDYGQMYIADWIALASPALAEPLAAWLEAVATDIEISAEDREAGWAAFISPAHPALAVARAVNGSTS